MKELSHRIVSRRDFLKLSGLGIAGGLLSPSLSISNDNTPSFGRVIYQSINVYDQPSLEGKIIRPYWKDNVVPIYDIFLGEDRTKSNPDWFRVGGSGYINSSQLQPVEINYKSIPTEFSGKPTISELSMPFTDAYAEPAIG